MGDGLYAQMERGNVMYYNKFSLKFIEDALLELSTSKLEEGERTFLIRTGEYGMRLFSNAARNAFSGWTEFDFNGDALGIVKKNGGVNSYTLTNPQFTEYIGPNGLRIKVEVDSFYDDPVINKINHPNGGKASSYRFDIFDIGTMNQPNIFKCGIKGQPTEARSIQWGLTA